MKSLTITLLLARCESLAECEELLDSLREAYPCFDKQFMDLSVFEILINKAANWKERVSFLKEAVRTEAHDFYNITEFLAEKCNSYEEFEFVAQLLAEDPLLKEKVLARGDFFIAWMSKFPDRAKDIYLVATEKFGLGRNSYLFICMKGFVSMEDFFYFLMATEKSGQVSHYIEKPFILGSIQFWSAEKGFLYLNWIAKHGGVVDAEIIKAFSDKFKLADFSKYMSKIVKLSETFYPAVLYPLFHAGVKAALKESGAGGVVDMLKLFIENDLDFDLTGILDSFFLEENLTQINEIQSKVEAEFSSEDGVCDNKFLVQMNEWIETKKAYAESRFDEYFARCESVGGVIQGVGKMFKERVTPDEAIVNALDLVVMDPMFREQLRQRLILFFEPVLKGDVESLQDLYFDEILGLNNEVSLGAEEEVIDFDGWVKLYGITMPANRRGEEICAILDRQWVDVENHEGDITVLDCFDEYLKSMKRPAVMRVKAHMEFLFKTVETPRA